MSLHYKEVMGLIPKKLCFTGLFNVVVHLTIININSGCSDGISSKTSIFNIF